MKFSIEKYKNNYKSPILYRMLKSCGKKELAKWRRRDLGNFIVLIPNLNRA